MPPPTDRIDTAPRARPTHASGPLTMRGASARGPSHASRRTRVAERRDPRSRIEVLRRVVLEYDDLPGLRLTAPQARRLFGLRDDICTRVLKTLVDARYLRQDTDAVYRRHEDVWTTPSGGTSSPDAVGRYGRNA